MKTLSKFLFSFVLLFISVLPVIAQSESAKPRKFKTTYQIDMFAEATFRSSKISKIPANVVLQALEETEPRGGGYIRVTYKNKTGYILKAEVERHMDVPAPEIVCFGLGYKIIGSVYRYSFTLRNDGTLPYAGKITMRLFDKDGKTIYGKAIDFADDPIKSGVAGIFSIDALVEAPMFEVEHNGGKIKVDTGRLIERLP